MPLKILTDILKLQYTSAQWNVIFFIKMFQDNQFMNSLYCILFNQHDYQIKLFT